MLIYDAFTPFVNTKMAQLRSLSVQVPKWQRGEEWAQLTLPESNRIHKMYIMGTGTSVGTQSLPDAVDGELTAPIVIIDNFDKLEDCETSNIVRCNTKQNSACWGSSWPLNIHWM